MAHRMRAFDWSKTPLGPPESWPQSLRSAVSILLPSKAQIILFWGPEFVVLYNDAYRPVFGGKHPGALGLPGREAWSEIWDSVLHELLEGVRTTGEAFGASDRLFVLERFGYVEETFFDVSYDPVRDETGAVGGVFCIVSETTGRVLSERRLKTLRELGLRTTEEAKSAEEACRRRGPRRRGAPARPAVEPPLSVRRRDGNRAAGGSIGPARWIARSLRSSTSTERRSDRRHLALPSGPRQRALRDRHRSRAEVRDTAPRSVAGATAHRGGAADRQGRSGGSRRLPGGGHQPAPRARRAVPRVPRSGGQPDRHRDRQRPRLRGGAQALAGARRARSRQDRLLQQRQPRVPHAADAHARPGRGAVGEESHRPVARRGQPSRRRQPQRSSTAAAGQHPARLLAHRGRPGAGLVPAHRPRHLHRRARERLPGRRRARRAAAAGRLSEARANRSSSIATCGRRWFSTCSRTPSSSPSKARSRSRCGRPKPRRSSCACATPAPGFRPRRCRACSSGSTASRTAQGRTHEGSGIGLALVQELVKLHGGIGHGGEQGRRRRHLHRHPADGIGASSGRPDRRGTRAGIDRDRRRSLRRGSPALAAGRGRRPGVGRLRAADRVRNPAGACARSGDGARRRPPPRPGGGRQRRHAPLSRPPARRALSRQGRCRWRGGAGLGAARAPGPGAHRRDDAESWTASACCASCAPIRPPASCR